jgi:phage replication O-like protein O
MAKKLTEYTQIKNNILEGLASARLKPTEWQFLMALIRLTYGRKNMKTQDGQWTPWIGAEFQRLTGLNYQQLYKIKVNLLKLRVIKKRKGDIGFNKHFDKWSKQTMLSKQTTGLNRPLELSKQTSTVVQIDHKDGPKVKTSEEVQRLKKERKKETTDKDKLYIESFLSFWEQYPKKEGKFPAAKAWKRFYEKEKCFELGNILSLLQRFIKVDWAGREQKYIPLAGSWLNKRPWDDHEFAPEDERKEEMALEIRRLNMRYQSDPDMKRWDFEELRQQIINTYKEKK